MLHFLYPEVFTDKTSEGFRRSFDLSKGQISTSFMDDARRLLELIMLRRMKNSPLVNLNLPPKNEILLYVPLTPMQRFWYKRLLTRTDKGLLEDLFQGAKDKEMKVLKDEQDEERLLEGINSNALLDSSAIGEPMRLIKGEHGSGDVRGITRDDLRYVETERPSGVTDDSWAESKAIMKRAVELEKQDSARMSDWRRLMNLLMQLRKVRGAAIVRCRNDC